MKKTIIISLLAMLLLTGCGGSKKTAICTVANENSYLKSTMDVEVTFDSSNERVTTIEKTMTVELTDIEYVKSLCGNIELSNCVERIAESTKEGACKEQYKVCEVKDITDHSFIVHAVSELDGSMEEWDGINLNQSKEDFVDEMKKVKNITCE